MATVKVNVTVETEAQFRVIVDVDEVDIGSDGKGEFIVQTNEEKLLTWIIIGSPGEDYKIELTPSNNVYKVTAITGKHPINSSISTRLFRASGHIRFKIERK